MQKRLLPFLLTVLFFLLAAPALASTGFIGNPIWIYPEYPREGESVTLSALFHNGETEKLSGTVLFYDNDTLLEKKSLTIPAGDVGTATVVFAIGPGNHVFSATASGFQEISSTGAEKAYSLPLGKAEMPKLFVTKNGSGSGADALGLKASAEAAPILDKVDQAQNKVLDSIPDSIKQPVVSTAQSIESWRATTADKLESSVASAQANVEAQKKIAADQTAQFGKVSPSTHFIDSPFATIKLFVAELFRYVFSHAFIFYVAFFALAYFLIRSIIRKVKRMRHERRVTNKVSSKIAKQ